MEMCLKIVIMTLIFLWKLLGVDTHNIRMHVSNDDSTHTIDEMAVEILSKCYTDFKETIIHGNSDISTVESFQNSGMFGVILFSDSSLMNDSLQLRLYRSTFVMTPYSVMELEGMMSTFKSSSRWDIKVPSFILDKTDRQCSNARRMLKTMWEMNVIKSFFLCVNSRRVPMIYTYNPYTNRAPKPWNQVPTASKKIGGWTMYTQSHLIGNYCDALNFDRTRHLDGSVIRVAVKPYNFENLVVDKEYDEKILPQLSFVDIYILKRMKYFLNVTLKIKIGKIGTLNTYINEGSCDVLLGLILSEKDIGYPVSYPSYYIVTNNRGFYTPMEKIANYYGLITLVSMCILLAMTFIVIAFTGPRRRWAFAAFEVLRLVINAALYSRMDTIAKRIFFSMIFLYFLIMQATFSGHLVGFLMKKEYRANAETLADLEDPRYDSVHIHWNVARFITNPILKAKLIPGDEDCTSEIIGKESAVCICTKRDFQEPAFIHKFHVSKEPVFRNVNNQRYRRDWPLQERYDIFLKWLESSQQMNYNYEDNYYAKKDETQKREAAMAEEYGDIPISMSMLLWIFISLAIGIAFSIIIFSFEQNIEDEAVRRRQIRQRRRNAARRQR